MKLQCNLEQLKNAIALADRMTGKNLTLPTLHALLLRASGTTLSIRATNLAVGIEIAITAKIESEGMVLVKGDVMANVCNHLGGNGDITLSVEHDNVTIVTAQNTTVIKCLPPDDFPTLPTVEGEQFDLKSALLQDGIRSVYFCAATTEIKPEIASIFLFSEENNLVFVATDSFRLGEKKLTAKGIPDIAKILIPYKNIPDMLKVLDVIGDTVSIAYSRNQISFSGNGIYFTSRLIDGAFPDYRRIMPTEEHTKTVLMKQELLNALRLLTVFADKFFQIIYTVSAEEKSVTIASKNADVGSSISSINAVISGDSIEVGCHLKYFLDVFQSLNGDSISLSFTAPNKPILVKSVQDTSFTYLLMPTNR